jgi:hypothetical protein
MDNSKFTFKKLGKVEFKNSSHTDFQIGMKDEKSFLSRDDINYIVNGLTNKAPKGTKFTVHGLGIAGMHELGEGAVVERRTLKAMDGELDWLEEDEYLDGRVKEDTKFRRYFQVIVSLVMPNKKPNN